MLKYQKKGLCKALSMLLAVVMLMTVPIGTTQAYAEVLDSGAPEATPSDAEETGLERSPAPSPDANEIHSRGVPYGLPAEIEVGTVAELEDALNNLADGNTIKLAADINYNKGIVIDGITMAFDVGQYKLNITNPDSSGTGCGLEVKNGGTVTLAFTTGELNASGHYYGVKANGSSTATLTNATATGANGYGAFAVDSSEITVLGDAEAAENGSDGVVAWQSSNITVIGNVTGSSLAAKTESYSTIHIEGDATATGTEIGDVGVFSSGNGKITVDGVINVKKAENYVRVNGANFTIDAKMLSTTKAGYRTYMHPSHTGPEDSVVWVKGTDTPATVIAVGTPEELKDALDALSDGDTIKLTANINYSDSITISKAVIFDVGQYILNITATEYDYLTGLEVTGSVSLISTTGELNITGSRIGVMVRNGEAASATVTNATATRPDGIGIHATSVQPKTSSVVVQGNVNAPHTGVYAFGSGSSVTVHGNVNAAGVGAEAESDANIAVHGDIEAESCGVKIVSTGRIIAGKDITTTGADSIGAWITNDGTVRIDGDITAVNYIKLGSTIKLKGDGVADPDLSGFTKYSNGNDCVVRIKGVAVPSDKVCEISGTQYATLDEALAAVQSGDRIKLLKDINYPKGIAVTGKHIIFDVGPYKLNITNSGGSGLDVSGTAGRVSLSATTGELNVTGTDYGIRAWSGGAVTVTNATATAAGGNGIYASGTGTDVIVNGNVNGINSGIYIMDKANVLVKGDVIGNSGGAYASGSGSVVTIRGKTVATTGVGVFAEGGGTILAHGAIEAVTCGARISNGGTITAQKTITATGADGVGAWLTGGGSGGGRMTIDGAITAANYINLSGKIKLKSDGAADSSKPGYTKYTDGDDRVVWVKAAPSADITSSFTDSKFLAAVRSKLGKYSSDPIYTADVAGITDLGIVGKGITSLAGIEHFTALITLDCSNNQLTALDVSGLTELDVVKCSKNKLTTLNVSGLTKLTELSCNENYLTVLDVSSSTEMVVLSCYENKLTALNVSGLTNLTKLYCRANQITALDVSGSTKLTELICSENRLTALDVSRLPKLDELYCSDNLLTGLVLNGSADYSHIDARNNYMVNESAVTGKNITWDNYRFRFSPQKAPQATYPLTVQGGTGGGSYTEGSIVTIIANAAPGGQRFKEWVVSPAVSFEGDTKKTDATASISMPAQAVTATATYEALPAFHYAITVQSDGNGAASANINSAAQNTEITLTATPNSNYRFKEWQVVSGGVTITANKFTMPSGNVTVKAIFEPVAATYLVTVNGSYASPTGAGSYPANKVVTIQAGSRSNYSFAGWTSSDVAITNAGSKNASFTMPGKAVTVTANWTDNGSGSSGGGDGGGNTSTPPTSTVVTDKQPDMPTTAKMSAAGTVKDGVLSATITEQMVKDAIKAAQDAAKKSGKEVDGIALDFNITGSGSYTGLSATIDAGAIACLKEAGIKFVKIGSAVLDITIDAGAIAEIDGQSSGTVTVSAKKLTKLSAAAKRLIGNRPVFDITVSYQKNGKTETISNFGKGAVTLGLAYKGTDKERTGNLFGVYVDKSGKPQLLTNSSYDNGRLIFSRNSLSTYGVGYKASAPAFTDTAKHWAKDNIDFVVSRDLISGTTATTFAPNTSITRADFLTALGRLSGADVSIYKTSGFTDVRSSDSTMPYIEWTVKNKIVSGYGNGKFRPSDLITREQMAVMMQNYAKATGYKLPTAVAAVTFSDGAKISAYAKDAVKAIQQAGIMQGKGSNTFDPQGNATRAEASTILRRFVELVIDEGTARGWNQNDGGQWQYISVDGKAATGWLTVESAKYYFTTDGVMISAKWLQIEGKWYYFQADGSLAVNTKIDGYEVNENGVRKSK